MAKNIKVTKESKTGRNQRFEKPNGKEISRQEFVKEIEQGKHEGDYHNRKINKVKTPVSNPDGKNRNNLG
ncbi:MAG: hypothetical protein HOE90_11860 [Bacteriovoracaceae bacterium]|jgi:hypothetical protein|nr:hypothetical protein [Bacteriovoracaceae bacterium]